MLQVFDYLLLSVPALVITIWAHWSIRRARSAGSKIAASCGLTGAEAATAILNKSGVPPIAIAPERGPLCNHYDADRKTLRLAHGIHDGRSLAALAIAAHEAGHAIQDAAGARWLILRNLVVPWATIGSQLAALVLLAGFVVGTDRLILAGVLLFSALVVIQLVNLPVEYDASRRARLALDSMEIVSEEEKPIAGNVLDAVAWTYVASSLTGVRP
jgi:Zn-dependent membrane protease YugP